MKIIDFNVFGINEALRASGLPMDTDGTNLDPSLKRGKKLGRAKVGSGHDCFLKGITVNMVIEAPVPFWGQWGRYAFQDIVSSTSQMHKLDQLYLESCFMPETPKASIDVVIEQQKKYNENPTEDNYRSLLFSVPQGFIYKRAVVTNYLQLKTMYYQRRNHKLREWRELCDFFEELPLFMELIGEVD